jgi:hypothetical protein
MSTAFRGITENRSGRNEIPLPTLYEQVPIMFGANSHEGSFVYGVVYNGFLVPNNLTENEDFLRHELLPYLLRAIGVTNSYAMEAMLKREYFEVGSSLGRYVFGSEISYNKAPPRLPGLGC